MKKGKNYTVYYKGANGEKKVKEYKGPDRQDNHYEAMYYASYVKGIVYNH